MTSEPKEAFVWVWLPGAEDPVVAGRLDLVGDLVAFTYGRSYLDRPDRIALYLPELPLRRGRIMPLAGTIAGCTTDAGPDAWGQRVILNRRVGRGAEDTGERWPNPRRRWRKGFHSRLPSTRRFFTAARSAAPAPRFC